MASAASGIPSNETGEPAAMFSAPWIRDFAFYITVGVLIVCVNFHKFLTQQIDLNISSPFLHGLFMAPVQIVQWCIAILIGPSPPAFFGKAIGASFVLLWFLLGALAILSIRRASPKILLYFLGGMFVGYVTLHFLAWLAVVIITIVGGAIFVVSWVASVIFGVVAFVLYYTWPILLLAATFILIRFRRDWFWEQLCQLIDLVRAHIKDIAGAIAALLIVAALIRWVVIPIVQFLAPFALAIWKVVKAILTVLLVVIFAVLAFAALLIALALVGSLLVSQLQAGWNAARSVRDMLIAGFAIGSSLTLIVVVSVATPSLVDALNHAWNMAFLFGDTGSSHAFTDLFAWTLPGSVKAYANEHLTNLLAPGFDGFIFLVVTMLSLWSVAAKVFSADPAIDEDVPLRFVAKEYAKMAGGLLVGLLLIFAQSETGDSHVP